MIQPFYYILVPFNMIVKVASYFFRKKINLPPSTFFPYIELVILYIFNPDIIESILLFFHMQAMQGFMISKVLFCGHRIPELWTEGA